MYRDEWYFNVGYVELGYVGMVTGIFVALYFFARLNRVAAFSPDEAEEKSVLLGLVGLAIVLFMVNRVLEDLW